MDSDNSNSSIKDERNLDEDELLLRSEEGKKMSSKERRQVRNRVSARHFRVRRKEFIGKLQDDVSQLEAKVASLTAELEQSRMENARMAAALSERHAGFASYQALSPAPVAPAASSASSCSSHSLQSPVPPPPVVKVESPPAGAEYQLPAQVSPAPSGTLGVYDGVMSSIAEMSSPGSSVSDMSAPLDYQYKPSIVNLLPRMPSIQRQPAPQQQPVQMAAQPAPQPAYPAQQQPLAPFQDSYQQWPAGQQEWPLDYATQGPFIDDEGFILLPNTHVYKLAAARAGKARRGGRAGPQGQAPRRKR